MRRWLACGGAVLLAGCASLGLGVEPIEVNVVDLTPLPSTAFEHRLLVQLRLRNPNDRGFEVDGLRFVLDVNGERLASGVTDQTTTLPRLGETVIAVPTTTTLLDVVNQVVAFTRMSDAQQPRFDYELRGRIFLAHAMGGVDFDRHGSAGDLVRMTQP
jgi:LEA14-like dessication related protein